MTEKKEWLGSQFTYEPENKTEAERFRTKQILESKTEELNAPTAIWNKDLQYFNNINISDYTNTTLEVKIGEGYE